MRSMRYFERGRTRVSVLSQIRQTRCQDGAVSANFTSNWDASATECVQPLHRFERFGSAAVGGSSTRPRRHLHREVRARRLANPLLCCTHTRSCMSPRQPTHALCMSPISWLAAWNFAEGLAAAERYAVAMAVATDMAAARLLPSPRQPSRSKRRGRGGMSGSCLAQPRVRKLWQCERARRPARGVLRSSTARPQQHTPAPCPRQLARALPAAAPRAKPHAAVRARLPLPSQAHASPCPRPLMPASALASSRQPLRSQAHASPPSVAPAHASRQLPSVGRSSRQIPVLASGHRRRRGGPSGGMGPAAMRRLSREGESALACLLTQKVLTVLRGGVRIWFPQFHPARAKQGARSAGAERHSAAQGAWCGEAL